MKNACRLLVSISIRNTQFGYVTERIIGKKVLKCDRTNTHIGLKTQGYGSLGAYLHKNGMDGGIKIR